MSTPNPTTVRRRRLVMQHDNRLTVEEAEALLHVLGPVRNTHVLVASAFRKIELCKLHAERRTAGTFGPGATADAPPPLRLTE